MPGGGRKLNPSQNTAVRAALKKQFTVIQGPPGGAHVRGRGHLGRRRGAPLTRSLPTGTGKTVVGFHIVFWFHKLNEELPPSGSPPCILYCGPSNKSVDVVAGALGRPGGGCAQGCQARGTATHSLPTHRHAVEQESRAKTPPRVWGAGRGHRVPGAWCEQQGPAQEDPSGGEAQPNPQVQPVSHLSVCGGRRVA